MKNLWFLTSIQNFIIIIFIQDNPAHQDVFSMGTWKFNDHIVLLLIIIYQVQYIVILLFNKH